MAMQKHPAQQVHYGVAVWVNPTTESMRKAECLCLNCDNMRPGTPVHCHIASALYGVCCDNDIALTVTRCPLWKPKG